MAEVKFTDEQQSVIDARNCNILVSAAAGSGKTAVLVERIIQLISSSKDCKEPLDIDHLLVVTFTRAAAAQMKDKITAAIAKRLLQNPEDVHLQKQETLIHNAQITTIDSFCQYIIRNNFNDIGLDPSYRVADEGEIKLLEESVMADFLEAKYVEADEEFLYTSEYFSNGSDDKELEEQILRLYKFSTSMPWPVDWLKDRARDYDIDEDDFDDKEWIKEYVESVRIDLKELAVSMRRALDICNQPDGPYMYGDLIEAEKNMIISATKAQDYESLRNAVNLISFERLPGKRDESVSADKKEMAKAIRDDVKDSIKNLKGKYFAQDKETIIVTSMLAARALRCLSELTIEFKEALDNKKKEKNIIDFSDMEHFALNILVNHDPETRKDTPTDVAAQYREYYKEILIDEYQDSNSVQELILSAIAGNTEETYDRFMVGDVKQSIYKFRLARPEIFMEKLESYDRTKDAPLRRIDLHRNFRSRRRVLDFVNYIFRRIMGSDLGKVAYDLDAMLITGADYPDEPKGEDSFVPELILINGDDSASNKENSDDEYDSDDEKDIMNSDIWGMEDTIKPGQKLDSKQKEAMVIASRIKELVRSGRVSDGNGGFRSIHFSDIVILLRTTLSWDDTFRKILEAEGIPAYVESRTGYFAAIEVATLLNYLRIVDNPLQDIPLASVMHSVFGRFTDEDMARIKAFTCERMREEEEDIPDTFYEHLIYLEKVTESGGSLSNQDDSKKDTGYPATETIEKLAKRVHSFLENLRSLRKKAVYMPVHELLEYIIDSTGYRNYVSAMPAGTRRRANIDMLLERATSFENTSFKGLFNFIRYIEELEKYEVDFGEANVIDENADVVRIMSIHKSKGLEFPVVFVAGTSKKFNQRDTNAAVLLDEDLGIGLNAVDSHLRVKANTPRRIMLSDRMKRESLGEELRVLYVALTRAKEKLIITGLKSGIDNFIKNEQYLAFNKGPSDQEQLLPLSSRKATDYLTLILSAMMGHPAMKDAASSLDVDVSLLGYDDIEVTDSLNCKYEPDKAAMIVPPARISVVNSSAITSLSLKEQVDSAVRKDKLECGIKESDLDEDLMKNLIDNFEHEYSHKNYADLYTKTTVSELKKASFTEEKEPDTRLIKTEDEEKVPGFISDKEEKLSGAGRGTAYHRVMELLDESIFSKENINVKDILDFLEKKEAEGRMDADSVKSIYAKDIIHFLSTDLGKRYKEAAKIGKLYRERQFMMGIPATELSKAFPEGEIMLIQGVIDAWFIENDEIVLVDYKTDRIKEASELTDRYKVQIDYYTRALERMTHKKVKERYLYSFTLGEEIQM